MHKLAGLHDHLIENFNREAAAGMSEVVQLDISDAGNYYLIIDDGNCHLYEGEHNTPSVTISMDSDTVQDILAGKFSGMQAFLFGKVKAAGDQKLAAMVDSLFVEQPEQDK
ncbi:MAG: SCP2 sterol-binding domain-containing protein [Cellvibrionaceae bacterium]|nr:SCP2 sterol-binding domain-containing protein [Cellvibrionaceae bacterium]MCV6627681.1 SCP2 sterol-binding domain-containing protein [Cellvibrionaceae bacterium]